MGAAVLTSAALLSAGLTGGAYYYFEVYNKPATADTSAPTPKPKSTPSPVPTTTTSPAAAPATGTSATAVTITPVDCKVSWSGYGACDPATSTQTSTATVVTPAAGGGAACPALTKTQACTPPYIDLTGWWNGMSNNISTSNGSGSCTMGTRPTAAIRPVSPPNKFMFTFPDDRTYNVTANSATEICFSNGSCWHK